MRCVLRAPMLRAPQREDRVRALLVESNRRARASTAAHLADLGVDCLPVADAVGALRAIARSASTFDVVLIGRAALDAPGAPIIYRLRRAVSGLTIVVVAAGNDDATPADVVTIRKPFRLADLRHAIARARAVDERASRRTDP